MDFFSLPYVENGLCRIVLDLLIIVFFDIAVICFFVFRI